MQRLLTALIVVALCGGLGLAQDAAVRTDLSPKDRQRVRAVTAPATDFSGPEPFERLPGGAATSRKLPNRDAFSFPSANLSFAEQETFNLGNGFFTRLWATAPSSTHAADGLGPLFNARGCQNCHLKDGRGHPPMGSDDDGVSMFLRLSVPAKTADEQDCIDTRGTLLFPEPTYGEQLQVFAVPGVPAEGRMVIRYADAPATLGDGTVVTLRSPSYAIADLGYGPMSPDTMISPRLAPPMLGLGLLEAIPDADILAHADADDRDSDGISGRPNMVLNPATGEVALGRFGWKAGAATIRAQAASAFASDIGISTSLVDRPHGDCTDREAACLAAPTGEQARLGTGEAPDPILDLVTFYSQNLGVPQRRDVGGPAVLRGKAQFYGLGCTGCHTPKYVTSREAAGKAQKFQLIWPYTDLLLHDMGEGLADHRPEGAAGGTEWRTPPLWGIGLTKTVSGHTLFLHDGRARGLTEAILWHGGEAQKARDGFAGLPGPARDDLLAFLESL